MAKAYRVTTFVRINNTMITSLLRLGIKLWSFSLLTVRGRTSGKPIVTPIAIFVQDQQRYLIAAYGVVNWVRNLRAAGGEATLTRRRHNEKIRAIELEPEAAALVFRAALRSGPPGVPAVIFRVYRALMVLPYLDVTEHASLEDFEREVLTHPVFLVQPAMEHVFQKSSQEAQETKKEEDRSRQPRWYNESGCPATSFTALERRGSAMRARDENPWRAKGNTLQEGVETNDEVTRESGVTLPMWRLYQHFWLLICLYFPLASLVSKPDAWLRLAVGSTALLFFAISYTWIMWPHPASQGTRTRGRSHLSVLLVVALSLQVTVFSLLDDPAWLWSFLGVSAMAGVVLPMRRAGVVVVLLTALLLLITLFTHRGVAGIDWWWLIALMLLVRGLGLDMIGVSRLFSAIRELHAARRELAHLAVIEERERLSRDLHDLLGQALSMITLKSELARGLITEDPARCAQELAEIEQVGRMTLREVRKTVAGYRQPRLSSELDGARQLLEAAGSEYSIEGLPGELPQPLDAVLAWMVREGVTNVIRHSRARHCLLRFTRDQGWIGVEMLNDGAGAEDAPELCLGQGSGLLGLRERVSGLGGTMEAGPLLLEGEPHFRLHVELPMQPQVEVTALQEERS